MTYNTASRLELARNQAASRSPYALSSPVAAALRKPVGWAAKSHARPSGCSPHDCCRQHAVYRVNPDFLASCRACSMRGVTQPFVVGSLTEQDSLGQLPSGLRGAGDAFAVPPPNPADAWPLPAPASAFSMSLRFWSIAATAACWVCISLSMAASCSTYRPGVALG